MLLSKLLHRDLANPDHKTNVHLHYDIQYLEENASFFSLNPETVAFRRKDPAARNISNREILNKKLRWMTLGGQYNWTEKVYPPGPTPPFPADIAKLITDLLPIMKPEAAIVNLYSPGDTLHMHRDVSEEVDASLISISLGCDAIFVVGIEDKPKKIQSEVLHLRSGDAVIMAGESRFAWHGVPKIIPATCPDYLASWPEKESYPQWDGWMKEKRINLNVRQMQEPRDLVGAEGRHHNNN
jgi:alkylated DNA repair protein alkB family protein 1